MHKKEARRGQTVPVPEKMLQFGAHKYLIWLALVRLVAADLAVRHRLSAAGVPQWCRLEAKGFEARADKLHMYAK